MPETKTANKGGRPSRSLEDEIALAEERLNALRERKRQQERAERERNQKAIVALIRSEGLDDVSAEVWRAALPKLREALKSAGKAAPKAAAPAPATPEPAGEPATTS